MKIKRLSKLSINSYEFRIKWDGTISGGSFNYDEHEIVIGTKKNTESEIFNILCHELLEACACECRCRFYRSDVSDDYYFMYDHRLHDIKANMLASLIWRFL
jgi:hypothetical protein